MRKYENASASASYAPTGSSDAHQGSLKKEGLASDATRSVEAVEQADAGDEGGASDGVLQLIRSVRQTRWSATDGE